MILRVFETNNVVLEICIVYDDLYNITLNWIYIYIFSIIDVTSFFIIKYTKSKNFIYVIIVNKIRVFLLLIVKFGERNRILCEVADIGEVRWKKVRVNGMFKRYGGE